MIVGTVKSSASLSAISRYIRVSNYEAEYNVTHDKMSQRFIEHIERLERDYEQLLDRMRETENMLAEHLTELSPIEQAIIIERYMHGKSWRQIEREYDYSHSYVTSINRRAIKSMVK